MRNLVTANLVTGSRVRFRRKTPSLRTLSRVRMMVRKARVVPVVGADAGGILKADRMSAVKQRAVATPKHARRSTALLASRARWPAADRLQASGRNS
jgi:hypothetical protein